jgi:acetyl esterase
VTPPAANDLLARVHGARVLTDARHREETRRFLAGSDSEDEPIPYAELVASRTAAPNPDLVGMPEGGVVRADVLLPLEDRTIPLRAYRTGPSDPGPLLLWLHGGGFVGGNLDDIDVTCAGLASRLGFAVLSLDYRLAPEHPYPAALEDTAAAIGWLQTNGVVFGGDGRLVVGGQSAGANLVAAACLIARDAGLPQVARQVLCYPWLDFAFDSASHHAFSAAPLGHPRQLRWYVEQYLQGAAPTALAAPLIAPDLSGLPPAMIIGAGQDPLRDDARRYAARLLEAGVEVSYVEYADAPHAFLNFPGTLSVAWDAITEIALDLRRALSLDWSDEQRRDGSFTRYPRHGDANKRADDEATLRPSTA